MESGERKGKGSEHRGGAKVVGQVQMNQMVPNATLGEATLVFPCLFSAKCGRSSFVLCVSDVFMLGNPSRDTENCRGRISWRKLSDWCSQTLSF